MKTLRLYEKFEGHSYADMINTALGTHYKCYIKAGVPLDDMGLPEVIAWFVCMDGSVNGYDEENYLWRNFLYDKENLIKEEAVSRDKTKVKKKYDIDGHHPFRLAFRILARGEKENFGMYKCEYVGAFTLSCFLREDLTEREYVRIAGDFTIGSKYDFGNILENEIKKFTKNMPKYSFSVTEMGFSDRLGKLLIANEVWTAGKLLTLGNCASPEIAQEIRERLYSLFKKPTPPSPPPIMEKPIELPQISEGMSVVHKKFGMGTVIKDEGKYIVVAFSCGEFKLVKAAFADGTLKINSGVAE